MSEPLSLFVVYHKPKDIPNANYVVRRWELVNPKELVVRGDTLESVRQAIREKRPHLYNIGRTLLDDPAIVEVWV